MTFLVLLFAIGDVSAAKALSPTDTSLSSFLWRTDDAPPSYFLATVHVPVDLVWDAVSPAAKQAFRAADRLFVEVDLADRGNAQDFLECRKLQDGQDLAQILPADLFQRLSLHFRDLETRISARMTGVQRIALKPVTSDGEWRRFRPVWIVRYLEEWADLRSVGEPPMDMHLLNLAKAEEKIVTPLESATDHCRVFNRLAKSDLEGVFQALNTTLTLQERGLLRSARKKTVDRYRRGDAAALLAGMSDPAGGFLERALKASDQDIAERLIQALKNKPDGSSYLVALDVAHVLGNSSVLTRVRDAGIPLEPVGRGELLPAEELGRGGGAGVLMPGMNLAIASAAILLFCI